jgi:hypothetical protein
VILSNILLGSKIKVGNTTRLRSAPGLNCEMICERTTAPSAHPTHSVSKYPFDLLTISLIGFHHSGFIFSAI